MLMKKFLTLITVLTVFVLCVSNFCAFAATISYNISGVTTVRAEDNVSYDVTLGGASGITGGIEGIQFDVSFDTSVYSFDSAANALSQSWQIKTSAISADTIRVLMNDSDLSQPVSNDSKVCSLKFTIKSDAVTGNKGVITILNAMGTSGAPNYDSVSATGISFTATVAKPLSTDDYLKSLTIDSGSLSPTFNKNTGSYTVSVPNSTDSMKVTGVAEDATATVKVNRSTLIAGETTQIIVTITAESGAVRTYTVNVKRDAPVAAAVSSTVSTVSTVTTVVSSVSSQISTKVNVSTPQNSNNNN